MRRVVIRGIGMLSILAALGACAPGLHAAPARLAPVGAPQVLVIPRIGVRAAVESLPFNSRTQLTAPFKWGDVAWFNRGVRPGQPGRAQIYGHVDSTCCPAVFWNLRELRKGDMVSVQYAGGQMSFKVQWQATYANSKMPDSFIYHPTQERGILLITCAGIFHHDGTGYDHKLVVYATLPPGAAAGR